MWVKKPRLSMLDLVPVREGGTVREALFFSCKQDVPA